MEVYATSCRRAAIQNSAPSLAEWLFYDRALSDTRDDYFFFMSGFIITPDI
jgi:hypothetical protein